MEDSYGLIFEVDKQVVGFAMGFFKQYDDIVGYDVSARKLLPT